MKCQDILQNELHEKHILDQLDGFEKEKYELHLKKCKDCQAELENQRTLIFGIREAGLAEMKNEIKRQVEIGERNHPGMAWGRLSKIAAVLFIFVLTPGVIIYMSKSNPELVPVAQQKTENAPADLPYSTADAAPEGRRDIMPTEMMSEADLEVLRIPKQTDARGKRLFKKNESYKVNALDFAFEKNKKAKIITERDKQETPIRSEFAQPQSILNEKGSSFKDEKEEAVLKPKLAATPQESQPKRQTANLNEPKIEVLAVSSSEHSSTRIYVYAAPGTRLKKTRQSLESILLELDMDSNEQTVSELWFISNGHSVHVNLKASVDEEAREVLARAIDSRLPKSFAVEIIIEDSLTLEMTWLVGSEFLKIKPEEIKIEISNKRVMRVIIEDQFIYETDLSKSSTKAVLLRNLIDKKPIFP